MRFDDVRKAGPLGAPGVDTYANGFLRSLFVFIGSDVFLPGLFGSRPKFAPVALIRRHVFLHHLLGMLFRGESSPGVSSGLEVDIVRGFSVGGVAARLAGVDGHCTISCRIMYTKEWKKFFPKIMQVKKEVMPPVSNLKMQKNLHNF